MSLPPEVSRELPRGKKPARYDPKDIHLDQVVDLERVLPRIPAQFGHDAAVTEWGMLGNDRAGDCVWAGAAHETILWTTEAGAPAQFDDQSVLSDYAAVTGYDPATGSGDDGTDVRAALLYRQRTGILDAHGNRHRIGAFLALEPGNHHHLAVAMYLFGAAGIGFVFPNSAMDQFNAGQPWRLVAGAQDDGGHYVPLVARRSHMLECVTWAKTQLMTWSFYTAKCDEAYAILSPEMLTAGKTPEGFDQAALQGYLAKL